MGWGGVTGFDRGEGWGVNQNQTSPDFRFPEVGISAKDLLLSGQLPFPRGLLLQIFILV